MFKHLTIILIALAIAACSKPAIEYTAKDVTQSHFKEGWQVNNLEGKTVTPKDFKGKITLVFFGYTYCPDFCPNTLWKLDQVKQKLGANGDIFQTIFVTIDPQRDTVERLTQYASNFPELKLITLRPTDWQIRNIEARFRTRFVKIPGTLDPNDYTIEHMTSVLIYDKNGNIQRGALYEQDIDEYVQDLKNLAGLN